MTPGRSARLLLALTLALAIAALPAGCSSYVRSVSPAIWQKQIQAYVAAANGDIHALRDVEVSRAKHARRR